MNRGGCLFISTSKSLEQQVWLPNLIGQFDEARLLSGEAQWIMTAIPSETIGPQLSLFREKRPAWRVSIC